MTIPTSTPVKLDEIPFALECYTDLDGLISWTGKHSSLILTLLRSGYLEWPIRMHITKLSGGTLTVLTPVAYAPTLLLPMTPFTFTYFNARPGDVFEGQLYLPHSTLPSPN
jgi:hypothetical protein